ncbi:MAG: hypothetical protein WBW38_07200, partial [Candidatus Sulfotelmatobacter sp.]
EHEARYLRFKADESSQEITGPYRQSHPEDNNERQAVHEHVSVPLPVLSTNHRATAVSAGWPRKTQVTSSAVVGGASR